MKYSLLFAATAAAYDVYAPVSSAPAKVSTPAAGGYGDVKSTPAAKATPCSTTVGSNGYTTVVPGYGKTPVTVTSQYQAYPTCLAMGYDGKSCDKWGEDKYVSTVITDYNKKPVTVTKVDQCVTVYQEKKTITHTATPTAGGYGAVSTPVGSKNQTGVWYELYEKVVVVEYQNIGKNILTGYSGSGLCQKCDNDQPMTVKEYKGGKWTEEKKTNSYGKPKEEVKVYEKPGVYTVPAKTITVYGSQSTGKAGEPCVYTYPPKTVTITKTNQPYTCTYSIPSKTPSVDSKTPTNDYGYKASSTPSVPGKDYPSYPSYPGKSNTTSTPAAPVYGQPTPSAPVYNGGNNGYNNGNNGYNGGNKPSVSQPSKPTSTPCDDDKKKATPTPYAPVYNNGNNGYGQPPASTPAVPAYGQPTPSAPVYNNGNSGYGNNNNNNNNGYVAQPTPTPAQPVYNNGGNGGYGAVPASTPTPAAPAYNSGNNGNSGYGTSANGKTYRKRESLAERRARV